MAALTDRDWDGDLELADALRRHLTNTPSTLAPLPVDLEELGEAFEESPGVESLLHLDTGTVWPRGLLDLGEEPDGYDPEDPGRWLPFAGRALTPPTGTWNASPPRSPTQRPLLRRMKAVSGKGSLRPLPKCPRPLPGVPDCLAPVQ